MGPSCSWGTTISQASPESWTLLVSKRKAMRSALPGAPAVTSVRLKPQWGPSAWIRCLRALRSSLASCTATTSNLETISDMHNKEWRSRLGESSSEDSHFSVRPPKARMFQVAISRFRSSALAGTASSRAERSRARSTKTSSGGGFAMLGVGFKSPPSNVPILPEGLPLRAGGEPPQRRYDELESRHPWSHVRHYPRYADLQVSYGKVRQSGPYGDAEGQPCYQPGNASAVHIPSPVLIAVPASFSPLFNLLHGTLSLLGSLEPAPA